MPQTNADEARELARNSSDCSFLLTHLIRQNAGRGDIDARNILMAILDMANTPASPLLKASSVGWYGTSTPDVFNPITGNLDGDISNQAVCFTESTLAGLRAHRDLFKVKYGLAFDRDVLFSRGANPCLNISESLLRRDILRNGERYSRHLYNFIPTQLQPFVNVIHDSFDATHEREWRHAGDMPFAWNDLIMIFCPEEEFSIFNAIQTNSMPCFFDLAWLDRV
ncbi:hypothetical protein [Aeromonas sp. R6-2]|uniref:hypothetical protein n=1 Tax=unclassified Aeromonas TaxID=257493 RepID=UPI0034A3C441